jgi:hypothetical protein
MRVVVPYPIELSYTNVAAASQSEWSSATTYGADAEALVSDDRVHKIYRSLRGNNVNRYPPDHLEPVEVVGTSTSSIAVGTGSKNITTQSGLGFSTGMVVKIERTVTPNTVNMTGEITAYNSGTGAMTVSVYSVTGSGTLTGWTIRSEDEIGFWEEVGATNQHKMIDEYVNTRTENTALIDVRFPVERVDFLTLFGLEADEVTVTLWNSTETEVVWSGTYDLIYSGAGIVNIVDWFEYFFGEFSARSELLVSIGAIVFQGVIQIEISGGEDETVACGNAVCGRLFSIGETQFGMDLGMLDFSKYETDEDGRTKVVPGYWSKKMEATVYMPNSYVDSVHKRLSGLVGIPTAWIGDSEYEASIVYGTFRDFSVTVEGPSHSFCSIEIEGLI